MMTARIVLLGGLASALGLSAAHGAATQPNGQPGPPGQPPPKLAAVRWQHLDPKYQEVFIDHRGRPWFLIQPTAAPQSPSGERVTALVCPDAPDHWIETDARSLHYGFDRQGRFWEATKFGLACIESDTLKFSEQKPIPGVDLAAYGDDPQWGARYATFGMRMLEHSTGRVYFSDSLGIHTLADGQWNYYRLDPEPAYVYWSYQGITKRQRESALAQRPLFRFAELADGRVIVWAEPVLIQGSPRECTHGLFVHDGKAWTHYSSKDFKYPKLAAIREITTQPDGSALIHCGQAWDLPVLSPCCR